LFLVGPNTFPLTWRCKKQGAVSHSSTEAEVIALDAAMRMEGIPILMFWDQAIEVFSNEKPKLQEDTLLAKPNKENLSELKDFAPPTLAKPGKAKLLILEDNEAVIKITIQGRSPSLRYVGRTHRVVLDFVSECFRNDTGIAIRFVGTKNQMADLLTKGSFTGPQWSTLVELIQLGAPEPPLANLLVREETLNVEKKKNESEEGRRENPQINVVAWSGSYPQAVPWSTQVRHARPPRRDRRMKLSFSFVAVLRPNLAHAQVQAQPSLSRR
jgi:hypothetical protein